jgi:hypothetical protein
LRSPGFREQQSRVKVTLFIGSFSMLDRRQSARDKVIYGGVAEIDERSGSRDCVVRNISENGAHLEFSNDVRLPKDTMLLTVARKGRSFLARIIWWRDNFVGVAFSSETPYELPGSDLAERLRKSEMKKRQLQRRIKQLLEG